MWPHADTSTSIPALLASNNWDQYADYGDFGVFPAHSLYGSSSELSGDLAAINTPTTYQ